MLEANVRRVLELLTPDALVLDVGGWACPFNRAQWVLDAEPYESRGFYRSFGGPSAQGGDEEWFTKERWVQRDLCDRAPWPFADKQFDYVVCSHTLEDLRDPLWVCSELVRVGKRGYVEVPSRLFESSRGVERPGMVGLSHHRWLVELHGTRFVFLQKFHFIHSHWRFSLPASFLRKQPEERRVQWLFWEGGFEYEERLLHGLPEQEAELEGFVRRYHRYPGWRLALNRGYRQARRAFARVAVRARSVLPIA